MGIDMPNRREFFKAAAAAAAGGFIMRGGSVLAQGAQGAAAKRRQIAKDVMVESDLKKLTAPDFTASIRPGALP